MRNLLWLIRHLFWSYSLTLWKRMNEGCLHYMSKLKFLGNGNIGVSLILFLWKIWMEKGNYQNDKVILLPTRKSYTGNLYYVCCTRKLRTLLKVNVSTSPTPYISRVFLCWILDLEIRTRVSCPGFLFHVMDW